MLEKRDAQIKKLEAENLRFRKALERYADEKNWDESSDAGMLDLDDLWMGDSGCGYGIAQEALKEKP